MRNILRVSVSLLFCLCLFLCLSAAASAESGAWGSLSWSLSSSGQLTISGTGPMNDFTSSSQNAWRDLMLRDKIKSVVIQNGVESIGEHAFSACSLKSVTIPGSVTSIGSSAFHTCIELTSVTIPGSVTSIGSSAFFYCTGLKSLTIPDSVTSIGFSAFSYCGQLESLTLSKNLSAIDYSTFQFCYRLKEVVIPRGVTSIGSNAFGSCSMLEKITIPNTVLSIGDSAFYLCGSLLDVYYDGSYTQWGRIGIGGSNGSLTSATLHCTGTAGYIVSYNANGGVGAPDVQTKQPGSALALSWVTPTRQGSSESITVWLNANGGSVSPDSLSTSRTTGYSFRNWNTQANGYGTSYAPGASYFVDDDLYLYAQWDSSVSTAAVTLPTPTRDGWTFLGWAASAGASSGVTGVYTPGGNETLYAIWGANSFTVSYNANGGYGAPASQTKPRGAALTLSWDRPIRDNSTENYTVRLNANGGSVSPSYLNAAHTTSYSFTSWNTSADGYGTGYAPGADYTADTNLTLYAQWNGSSTTETVTLPTPTRSGYIFRGWAESSAASSGVTGAYTPRSSYVSLYAIWESNTFTVTYDANGGTGAPASQRGTRGTPVTLSYAQPTRASASAGSCTVTLNPNGGSVSPRSISSDITTSYNFTGWNTQADGSGTGYAPGSRYAAYADVTLYAQWSVSTAAASIVLPTPTRGEGWAFRGWAESSAASSGVVGGYTPSGNVTLYAIWDQTQVKASGTWDGLSWWLGTNGVLTVFGSGSMSDFTSSSTSAWREYEYEIKSVLIMPGVTSIGANAFSWFSYLKSVSIPESVTSIGSSAFTYCRNLNSVTIPNSVKSVGYGCFNDCSSLTSAGPLGSGCEIQFGWTDKIPSYAFDGCNGLRSVIIPEGVTSLGNNVFNSCSSLESVIIPKSVTSVGYSCFNRCSSLTSAGPLGSGCDIQFGWTDRIPADAFYYCSGLKRVTIPESVTRIGSNAFYYCSALVSVAIPEGMTSIDSFTFENCTSLMSVTIPKSVTSIGSYAFDGCDSLAYILYSGSQTQWSAVSIGNYNNPLNSAVIIFNADTPDFVLPASLIEIGEEAFAGGAFTYVKLSDSTVKIGKNAFDDCPNLTFIQIPEATTEIDPQAFGYRTGLTILGVPGSAAESFAQDRGFLFVPYVQ